MTSGAPLPVLVVGEALIDVVVRPDAEREEHVGGSPANVALGLGRLEVPVRLRTALAHDAHGERIVSHLAASGVTVDAESFVLARTATAIAQIDVDGSARYEFDVEWKIDSAVSLDGVGILHVGSVGCFRRPGAEAVAALVRAADVEVTFDPNVRPALIGDPSEVVPIVEAIAARARIVKLSDEDADWLYPGYAADDVLDRLLERGAGQVVVTLGGDGAILASPSARVEVSAPRTRIRDTVGAGDAFMAALVHALSTGTLGDGNAAALGRLGRRCAVAAALTVSRAGADLPSARGLGRALSRDALGRRLSQGSGGY